MTFVTFWIALNLFCLLGVTHTLVWIQPPGRWQTMAKGLRAIAWVIVAVAAVQGAIRLI